MYASQVRKRGGDILFRVRTRRFLREFRLTMPGLFNVENALAAIAVCEGLNIPERCIYVGLMKARVPGRMEVYSNADETVTAIVDYAHNRMSFETLFRSVQAEYPGRRVISVFGCPGKKALDRRRDLGEIAGKYADLVVLTEEDSGEEKGPGPPASRNSAPGSPACSLTSRTISKPSRVPATNTGRPSRI